MSDVSISGLGPMGSALARALPRGGQDVTVWNRTSAKAEPLVRDGATAAPDLVAAAAASPLVVVSVENYEVTHSILSGDGVRRLLSGRVLAQLSTGSPQEARGAERWATDA